jgi:hypothetical protein
MNKQNIFNLVGLLLNMIGAFMMYYYTPKVSSQLALYLRTEAEAFRKKDLRRNKMIRIGMLLLGIGFLCQSAALLF